MMSTHRRLWILFFLCTGLISVVSQRNGTKKQHHTCDFNKDWNTTKCQGFGGMTLLPPIPAYMKELLVDGFLFTNLSEGSWGELNASNLEKVEIFNCHIRRLDESTFSAMTSLKTLHIANDRIPATEIQRALGGLRSPWLTDLKMTNLQLTSLPEAFFQSAGLQAVEELDITGNRMKIFNDSSLRALPSLVELEARDCNIEVWEASGHPNLTKIRLERSLLLHLPNFCSSEGLPLYPRLRSLYMKGNSLYDLSADDFQCLDQLQKLDISGNKLSVIKSNTFSTLPRLYTLFLDGNLQLRRIERFAFNSSSLGKLYLSRNPKWSLATVPHVDTFRWCPNLKTFRVHQTKIELPGDFFRSLLLHMQNVRDLDISKTYTYHLPLDTFQHMPRLEELNVASNIISEWPEGVFSGVRSIRHLHMSENNIKLIHENSIPVEFRASLESLSLARNPFNCICELSWFTQWLETIHPNVTVKAYPHEYRCRTPPELHGLAIAYYHPTALQCVDPYLVLSTVLPLVCLLLLSLSLLLYRYRISIRLWLYLLRKKRQHQVLENEEDFVFDAFVAYNKEDHAWVVQELLPLEARGLKLCLHERDFLAGRLVVDNIVDNMEASHKIIVIVSNSFLRSEWCQFELQEALECFLRKRKDVLLVLLEPIAARHVSRPLQVLMKRTTYVEWRENRAARRLFQERLAEPFHREEDTAF